MNDDEMYYEEMIIDDCMHYRTKSNGQFIKMTEMKMSILIENLRSQIDWLNREWRDKNE